MRTLARRWIGSRDFYKKVLAISVPIMLQNGISNFVGMLDNLMVGRIGTEQLSGVSIVNDLLFVLYLAFFGVISGAGIFTAQFFGQKNMKGVRDTFRIKLIIIGVVAVVSITGFLLFDKSLISLYLHEGSETGDLVATLNYGHNYMLVMLVGLIPFAIEEVYSSTLRETGETVIPMKASVTAVIVNLILNYVLIYGKLGLPAFGVVGAGIATVISRVIQMIYVIVWTHRHLDKNPYMIGAYKSMRVKLSLIKKIAITGLPLVINETMWAMALVVQKQSYSLKGLAVVAGMNINSTIFNVFAITFFAMGDAVAIIVGQQLGAGDFDDARDTSRKIIVFGTALAAVMGVLIIATSGLYPKLYNTSDEVRQLASQFITVTGIMMPLSGLLHVLYFTIRSGGKTFITFLFDSGFFWVIGVPLAYCLVHFTSLSIIPIFVICESTNIIKVIIGLVLYEKDMWCENIVR